MDKAEIKAIQKALKAKGFYNGAIDGLRGRLTNRAIIDFKKSIGYRGRDYVGPLTKAALFDGRVDPVTAARTPSAKALAVFDEPAWLQVGRSYLGLREYKGNRHNPKILEWWVKIRMPFTDDETPWCAGFVGGVLEECGIRSTRSAGARSYLWQNWGTRLSGPAVGAVVVFWRGSKTGANGHVGFVVGRDQHGNLMVLGGNQGDAVTIRPFSMDRVLSYHYPAGVAIKSAIGFSSLPVVDSNGMLSTNEA
ncbi:TIGR02594 family protein [Cohaesibacter haloalkalitolerans]|uniref:NlpC/P60 family protein n=1 Tax=Cohaesibacter haloalkalitolerans TaxID=1162980 RepID=UPI000E64B85A|nr:TIGR02594 family protein [Cohaesibacter haloalkalitolerans]